MGDRPTIGALAAEMEAFGLKHASRQLADQLESADANGLTRRDFLERLPACELRGRGERRRKRSYAAAHFPPHPKRLEGFDPSELEGGITPAQVSQLREPAWLDAHGNVVLAGPPGLGKTMVAVGPGLLAIDEGYAVAFEKMESLVRIMDDAQVDRKAGFRLRYLRRCQMVIVDEIGYTPITRAQANRFFSFVSDAYGRASLVFTTNKEIPDWAEMAQDPVLATAPTDRIPHHARCFSLRGESHRLKHPELYAHRD